MHLLQNATALQVVGMVHREASSLAIAQDFRCNKYDNPPMAYSIVFAVLILSDKVRIL